MDEETIQALLDKFYACTLTGEEQKKLYDYFLTHREIPEKWDIDSRLIRGLSIKSALNKQREELMQLVDQLSEEKKEKRNGSWRQFIVYGTVAAACVGLIVMGGRYFFDKEPAAISASRITYTVALDKTNVPVSEIVSESLKTTTQRPLLKKTRETAADTLVPIAPTITAVAAPTDDTTAYCDPVFKPIKTSNNAYVFCNSHCNPDSIISFYHMLVSSL